ncbi:family S53 protease-like protein [Cubamyces lactineus]|nr:family S53 protease-like protein [Cubamyces lactineus]
MHTLLGLLALVLVPRAIANPALPRTDDVLPVHESRQSLPPGFVNVGPAPSDHTLKLRFALSQNDPNAIVDALYRVSDPTSSEYGQYLSKAEVEQLIAPKSAATDAVKAWLQDNNFSGTALTPARDWIGFEIPVHQANRFFNANFSIFEHDETKTQVVRTMAYSLPASLQGHVDLVHPTISFPDPSIGGKGNVIGLQRRSSKRTHPRIANRDLSSKCANITDPECLQALYSIPSTPATNPDNRLGVVGFYGNSVPYSFLKQFLLTYRPDIDPSTNFTVDSVDGGVNEQDGSDSSSEGALDIEYTVGLATNVPVVYVFSGALGDFDGYLDIVNQLLGEENPPQVLSTSYAAEETSFSFALTDKVCKQYAQLGARGTSILFASGDSAAGCPVGNDTSYQVLFPSNCPFVTSVGGTVLFEPEEAWQGSGGGFSNYFSRPAYQDAAVENFFAQYGDTNADLYNHTGRAYPDISAKADDYVIYAAGFTRIFGTSASTPVTASIIALLNDRLASAGKPPLGFLNPWLYSKGASALTDIVDGSSNITCEGTTPPRGFPALQGWDPATGLGTPNFDKLLALLGL